MNNFYINLVLLLHYKQKDSKIQMMSTMMTHSFAVGAFSCYILHIKSIVKRKLLNVKIQQSERSHSSLSYLSTFHSSHRKIVCINKNTRLQQLHMFRRHNSIFILTRLKNKQDKLRTRKERRQPKVYGGAKNWESKSQSYVQLAWLLLKSEIDSGAR